MQKQFKKFSLLSLIVISFAFVIVFSINSSNVYAAASGTADGTYDFSGPLKVNNSGGAGYAIFADKFVVSNGFAITGTQLWSENQQAPDTTGTLVIKAAGTSTCKTFTFKDLGISAYGTSGNLTSLSVVLKDLGGATIATLSKSGTVNLTTTASQLSSLLGESTYNYNNVASITITWKFANTLAPSNLNFDHITIANVVGADVTPPTVSDGTISTSGITATGVTLNWTKATDAVSAQGALQYQVYRSSSNNLGTVANIETNGTAIGSYTANIGTYSVTGLTEGTTYYFNVIVKDEAGNKTAYTTKQVVTLDVTAPVVSVGALSTSGITGTGVTLNWTKATDAVSAQGALQYQMYRSSSNNLGTVANIETNGTAIGSYTANIGTYSVTGLTESTTYYFNVIVKDEAGNKTAYTTKQVVTLDVTAPVVSNSTLGASSITGTGVTL
ncbi:fibronectin type III domain-containing protein, partial [Paenibacillus alba]